MSDSSQIVKPGPPPRRRRTFNYWEPIFDPDEDKPYPEIPWNFEHSLAPAHGTFTSGGLDDAISRGSKSRFDKINFIKCDFFGLFDLTLREIVFNECRFEFCDFGLSTWKRAKFSKCVFISSSISQSKWIDCDFRSCTWDKIGISGNETEINATTISNPGDFIHSAYTNTDEEVLKAKKIDPLYQRMRLEGTKATVARKLSRMFLDIGEERAYYDAVKTSSNQSSKARIFESRYDLVNGNFLVKIVAFPRLVLNVAEWMILNAAGSVNAWGRSVVRPSLIGAAIVAFFTIAYAPTAKDWLNAFIKAVEITLLVGYTNHSPASLSTGAHFLVLANMIAGLFWYVVFIPTLINRVSRVR
ncbi:MULTISPECIES: hypothetical protein [unclassified Mesorhizobium]|uniref:anti-phage Hailong system effector protein HalA n=1 Tax=unclassified Mesorhizobium TaxID=325217 RepID=UPI0012EC4A56|nr:MULTISPECIES: hypothetical protein [unclassified Mesorhizobium]WJI59651.1 pentapeptide repeat-containing protein [Mesorhizobium sp. C432A]